VRPCLKKPRKKGREGGSKKGREEGRKEIHHTIQSKLLYSGGKGHIYDFIKYKRETFAVTLLLTCLLELS
jgi:hypothetical protein